MVKKKHTRRGIEDRELVPFGFMDDALKTLGLPVLQVLKLVGISDASYYKYKKTGLCPKWFRSAVNGLLAEHAGNQAGAAVPGKRKYKTKANGHAGLQQVTVNVPTDQLPVFRALITSLRYVIQGERAADQ